MIIDGEIFRSCKDDPPVLAHFDKIDSINVTPSRS